MLGTRDYVRQERLHRRVVIGLSGGIDSSLVAAIAVDALGPEHVVGVLMPSRFSSEGSVTDAEALAANLGIRTRDRARSRTRTPPSSTCSRRRSSALEPGLAEENLQARIRGTILMTMSQQVRSARAHHRQQERDGHRLLDALRRHGRRLRGHQGRAEDARVRARRATATNGAGRALIPDAVLEKPPSAELRPDQKDSDSLPEYDVLDPIIEGYVEDDLSIAELEAAGFDAETVRRVAQLVDRNEYKRRQAPPGRAGVAQGVRQGSPPADHQPLARLAPSHGERSP